MSPQEFKNWRKALGLKQKEAAAALEISVMSVQQYERGKRYDTGQPRPIPRHIEERCLSLAATKRITLVKDRFTLDFSGVSREERNTLIDKLATFGVVIDPLRSLYFKRSYFVSVWTHICEWLSQNVPDSAYMILNLGERFEDGGAYVLMQFFYHEDAARFVVELRDESDERAMSCSIVAAARGSSAARARSN